MKINEKVTKEMVEKALMEQTIPAEPLVYCGPSFPAGSLPQYAVYKNGIPEQAKEIGKDCPALMHLFKPVSKLAETRVNLGKVGSRDFQLYQTVSSYFQGRGNRL